MLLMNTPAGDCSRGRRWVRGPRVLRQLVVDALDVIVHAKELAVGKRLAGFADRRAVLLGDRAGEGMELAGLDLGDRVLGHLLHVVGHVGEGREDDHAVLHATPGVLRLPGAVENGLNARDVVGIPVIRVGRELGLGRELDHVGGLAEAELAGLFGLLQRRGRVSVLDHDVRTLAEQHLGGVGFLARIIPGVHPDDLDLEVRVHRLGAEHEGIDAHDDFRNREGHDVARSTRLRHLGGDLAHHVAAFIEARVVDGHVVGLLVARRVLELDVRILGRDLDGRVHEAEGGGEDDLAAFAREALDGAFGIRALGHVFEEGRLDLVAQRLLHRLAAEVVLIGITEVTHRAHIDPASLQLVSRVRSTRRDAKRQGRCQCHPFLHSRLLLVQNPFPCSPCSCCFEGGCRP